jgi:hypothetical protein
MKYLLRAYARHLLLLVPLTWPGFVYGLWQNRQRLWLSRPQLPVGQWWQQVLGSPRVQSIVLMLGVLACFGLVVFLGSLLVASWPRATTMMDGGDVPHATDVLVELTTVMTSPWVPAILMLTLVGMLVGLASGVLRMSAGLSKLILAVLLGGVGVSGLLTMLTVPPLH